MEIEPDVVIKVPEHGRTFVYFLIDDNEIVYVGKTKNGLSRPFKHDEDKSFDTVGIIECSESELDIVESLAIEKYQPKYNIALGALSASVPKARNRVRELLGDDSISVKDIKRAMSEIGAETFNDGVSDRLHAEDVLKIADHLRRS